MSQIPIVLQFHCPCCGTSQVTPTTLNGRKVLVCAHCRYALHNNKGKCAANYYDVLDWLKTNGSISSIDIPIFVAD